MQEQIMATTAIKWQWLRTLNIQMYWQSGISQICMSRLLPFDYRRLRDLHGIYLKEKKTCTYLSKDIFLFIHSKIHYVVEFTGVRQEP